MDVIETISALNPSSSFLLLFLRQERGDNCSYRFCTKNVSWFLLIPSSSRNHVPTTLLRNGDHISWDMAHAPPLLATHTHTHTHTHTDHTWWKSRWTLTQQQQWPMTHESEWLCLIFRFPCQFHLGIGMMGAKSSEGRNRSSTRTKETLVIQTTISWNSGRLK